MSDTPAAYFLVAVVRTSAFPPAFLVHCFEHRLFFIGGLNCFLILLQKSCCLLKEMSGATVKKISFYYCIGENIATAPSLFSLSN